MNDCPAVCVIRNRFTAILFGPASTLVYCLAVSTCMISASWWGPERMLCTRTVYLKVACGVWLSEVPTYVMHLLSKHVCVYCFQNVKNLGDMNYSSSLWSTKGQRCKDWPGRSRRHNQHSRKDLSGGSVTDGRLNNSLKHRAVQHCAMLYWALALNRTICACHACCHPPAAWALLVQFYSQYLTLIPQTWPDSNLGCSPVKLGWSFYICTSKASVT